MAKTPKPDDTQQGGGAPRAGVMIVSTHHESGRRRAGRQFEREPQTIPLDELTDVEIDMIQADPELSVKFVEG